MTMLAPVQVHLAGADKLAQAIVVYNLFFGTGSLLSVPIAGNPTKIGN